MTKDEILEKVKQIYYYVENDIFAAKSDVTKSEGEVSTIEYKKRQEGHSLYKELVLNVHDQLSGEIGELKAKLRDANKYLEAMKEVIA